MPAGEILVISGTNRPDSNAMRVSRVVLGHYQSLGITAGLFSLAEMPPQIFHPSSYAEKPDSFLPIQQRILDAAGLHVITPEYNGSFPGVLKYFVDMLKFPESFDRKPVAFVGEAAGTWGAIRSVEQLQLIFGYRNAYIYPERVFIPSVLEKFNPDGVLLDAPLDKRLARQARGFAEFINCIPAAAR